MGISESLNTPIPDQLADFSLIRVCRPQCTVHDDCDSGGKRPVSSADDIESVAEIKAWVADGGNAGIVPTAEDDLAILDVDSAKLAHIASKHLPETFTVSTHSGSHRYYRVPNWTTNHGWGEVGSIRADNWIAVIPPSTHPSGEQYTVEKNLPVAMVSPFQFRKVINTVETGQADQTNSTAQTTNNLRGTIPDLSFIHSDSIRNRIEGYLQASNPDHSDRVWLVGWLYHVPEDPNLSEQDIVDLIMTNARWDNLDREIVSDQVTAVIESSD